MFWRLKFPDTDEWNPAMKKLIALCLAVAFAALSCYATASAAPTVPSSALAKSGAEIAPPAKQLDEDKDDKKEHQDSAPEDSTK